MQIQDLVKSYQAKTDDELLQLATNSEQLTPEAYSLLKGELTRRGIGIALAPGLVRDERGEL